MSKKTKRIVLTRSTAGIFVGELESYANKEATLLNARRLWYWTGAASLSQLAQEGTKKPKDCKAPCEVSRVVITDVMEMPDVTKKAKATIDKIPVWSV